MEPTHGNPAPDDVDDRSDAAGGTRGHYDSAWQDLGDVAEPRRRTTEGGDRRVRGDHLVVDVTGGRELGGVIEEDRKTGRDGRGLEYALQLGAREEVPVADRRGARSHLVARGGRGVTEVRETGCAAASDLASGLVDVGTPTARSEGVARQEAAHGTETRCQHRTVGRT